MEEFREFTTSKWPLEVAAASDTASASKSVYVHSQIQKLSPRPLKRFLCKATTSNTTHEVAAVPHEIAEVSHKAVGHLESLQKGATASKTILLNFIFFT
jgi:hypothetical protein